MNIEHRAWRAHKELKYYVKSSVVTLIYFAI